MRLVASGKEWIGGGVQSIESALTQLLIDAEDEILLITYSITAGSNRLLEWIEEALNRGVQVKLLINRSEEQPEGTVLRLQTLAKEYPHFYFYSFKSNEMADLHAKAVVVDRKTAIIGSFNLSKRGLVRNHELGLQFDGPAVEDLVRAFSTLVGTNYVDGPLR